MRLRSAVPAVLLLLARSVEAGGERFEPSVGGARQHFERGTLVVPVVQAGVEAEAVHRLVSEAVAEDAVEVFALGGGFTPDGPDLGGPSIAGLTPPRVALLAGSGTDSYSVGEAWHLLTERAGLPIALLDRDAVGDADLSRYTTLLILGSFRGLDDAEVETLKGWVRGGGVLVAAAGAAAWAVEQGFADVETREADTDSTRYAYADLDRARGAQTLGGAIFESGLDTTHPLAFGHPERLPLFKNNTVFFDLPEAAGTTVAAYTDAPLLSGYVSDRNRDQIAGGAALIGQRMERGRVILFDFDPAFRAFWWGTQGLLLNAVFFGGAF